MRKRRPRGWYYVSFYQVEEVYEPAEGGYYYPTYELIESYRVGTLRKARKLFKNFATEFGLWSTGNFAQGNGLELRIETQMGIHEAGRRPYC